MVRVKTMVYLMIFPAALAAIICALIYLPVATG